MNIMYVLVGLPGSGKTTWAKAAVGTSEGKLKRVAKEDIRAMLDNGRYFDSQWQLVEQIRDAIIDSLYVEGLDVVIDETNLPAGNLERIIAKYRDRFDILVVNMMDVPFDECVSRDYLRTDELRKVGEENIRMYQQMYESQKDFWKQFPDGKVSFVR